MAYTLEGLESRKLRSFINEGNFQMSEENKVYKKESKPEVKAKAPKKALCNMMLPSGAFLVFGEPVDLCKEDMDHLEKCHKGSVDKILG